MRILDFFQSSTSGIIPNELASYDFKQGRQIEEAMRRTLQSTRVAELTLAVSKRAAIGRLTACLLLVAGIWSDAHAQQTGVGYPVSATTLNLGSNPVSSGLDMPTVDASYFSSNESSKKVQPASYWGDSGVLGSVGDIGSWGEMGYQALQESECRPGAYSCIRCDISCYVNIEALFLQRAGDRRFTLTQNAFMDEIEFEPGTRFTIGKMCDCANGVEFVYVGPFQWERSSTLTGAGNVDSRFVSFDGSTLPIPFNNANQHTQAWQAQANSFEINRRRWAWDSVSTLIGVRYFSYDEEYGLASLRPNAPNTGLYSDEIENHFVGAQLGGDLFFVTSLRTSISLRGKAGVYANFATREVQLIEDGASILFNAQDKVDVAGLFELGVHGNYQCTPSVRLNIGYELWYAAGTATISHQRPNILIPSSGTGLTLRDDLFLHGLNVGIQILR